MRQQYFSQPSRGSGWRRLLGLASACALAGLLTVDLHADDSLLAVGNGVGTLPNVAGPSGGTSTPRSLAPIFFVRIPAGLEVEEVIVDAWGHGPHSGGSSIHEDAEGTRRVEFWGDVEVLISRAHIGTPGVEAGILSGSVGGLKAAYSVHGSVGNISTIGSYEELAIPLQRAEFAGLTAGGLSLLMLQEFQGRSSLDFQAQGNELLIRQNQN